MATSIIQSNRELGRQLGVSEGAIRKWLRNPLWPFRRIAPWPAAEVAKMQAWRSDCLAGDRSEAGFVGRQLSAMHRTKSDRDDDEAFLRDLRRAERGLPPVR